MADLETLTNLVRRVLEQNATLLHAMSLHAAELDAIKLSIQPPPDQRLILALVEAYGQHACTAAEALRRARLELPALRAAIEAACGGRLNGKVLGRRLARIARMAEFTPTVVCLRSERSGCLWRIYLSKVSAPKPLTLVVAA